MTQIDISIVIVSWNVRDYLDRCLRSLDTLTDKATREVIVVDNDSADGSGAMVIQNFPLVRLIQNTENVGFAAGNNQALPLCTGRHIMLLNPDTEVHPGTLDTLVAYLDTYPKAGVAAPQLRNTDGTIQPSCRRFPTLLTHLFNVTFLDQLFPKSVFASYWMSGWDHNNTRSVDQPMGAALLIRREVIDQVGPMDGRFFLLFDEVDWCYRIKQKGWEIVFVADAKITHHGGKSFHQRSSWSNGRIFTKSRNLYFKKHYGAWALPVLTLLDIVKILIIAVPVTALIAAAVWTVSALI